MRWMRRLWTMLRGGNSHRSCNSAFREYLQNSPAFPAALRECLELHSNPPPRWHHPHPSNPPLLAILCPHSSRSSSSCHNPGPWTQLETGRRFSHQHSWPTCEVQLRCTAPAWALGCTELLTGDRPCRRRQVSADLVYLFLLTPSLRV